MRAIQPFPINIESISLYITYLVAQKQAYGTVLNHISSLKHAHRLAGYELTWSSDYHFQLLLRGVKRFLGQAVSRKSPMTPSILHAAFDLFNFRIPLHAAMWALILVAFFTFCANLISYPTTRGKFSPRLLHGQIWFLRLRALIFMFPPRRLSSVSNDLLFCPFPRSLGLVFVQF